MRHKVHVPPCRFCAKQFQRTEHLRRHERTHTREKPYGCYCGRAFTRRDLLSRHNKLAHDVPHQDERAVSDTIAANTTVNPTTEPMSTNVAPSGSGIDGEHGVSPRSADARGQYSSAGLLCLGTSPQDSITTAATSEAHSHVPSTGAAHLRTPPARCEDHHSSAQLSSHYGLPANIDPRLAASATRAATATTRSAATAATTAIPPPASALTSTQTHDANGLEGLGETAMPRIQDTLASQEMWDLHFADNLDILWGDPSTQPSLLIPPLFLSTLPSGVGVPIHEHSSSSLDMSMFAASSGPNVGMTVVNDIDFEPPRVGTFSRYTSRLPSMHLDNDEHRAPPGSKRAPGPASGKTWRALQPESASHREAVPWRISQEDHETILDHLQSHTSTLPPGFVTPSRHALCRYVEGFFTGFHEHLPCLHTPTFTLVNSAPELVMAIAATGARYRFQRHQADALYRAAMALLEAQLRRRDGNSFHSAGRSSYRDLQTMQAMVLLIALGTWNQRSVLREAFTTASQLATMVREQGLTTPAATRPESLTWHDWIAEEGARRVKIVAYSFSNLHSITYNIPPKLTTAEMGPVQLPAPETHWRAADEAAWYAARNKDVHTESSFAKSYSALFAHVADAAEQSTVSSFGNYVLMHGIIQQIFLVRQSSFPFASSRGDTRLPDDILEGLDTALRRWQRQWEMTRDSSLDPLAPGGPLSFNATALFRLAYIRLYADLGSYRQLDTRDPGAIAQGLREVPLLDRLSHVERAALQAAHSLSIPVHIGVEYVAQTQTLSWSIVHSLCNVECAIYLSKWLETVAMALAEGKELRTGERSIVSIVASIINETDLGPPLLRETNSVRRIRRMAAAVVRLWACTFRGAHVFEIMGTIGAGLDLFADMLQQTVTSDKETGPA